MTGGTMSRFAKTNGETQKLGTLKTGLDNDTLTKDGSGVAAFFRTLKNKLRKTESMSPKTANFHATSKFADDKTYFIKATGRGTMARPLYQADRVSRVCSLKILREALLSSNSLACCRVC